MNNNLTLSLSEVEAIQKAMQTRALEGEKKTIAREQLPRDPGRWVRVTGLQSAFSPQRAPR